MASINEINFEDKGKKEYFEYLNTSRTSEHQKCNKSLGEKGVVFYTPQIRKKRHKSKYFTPQQDKIRLRNLKINIEDDNGFKKSQSYYPSKPKTSPSFRHSNPPTFGDKINDFF